MAIENIDDRLKSLIIQNKKVPLWVVTAREYHKDWKALYYGEDFREKLLRIEHIESEKRAEARKKYSRPIKDLCEKHTRPIDSVYSAIGGSKNYPGLTNENQKRKFLETIANLRENKSLEKWLETYWAKDLYIVDPSGLIFLEYFGTEWIKPTYKSIQSIRNYECNGQKLNWLLFEPLIDEDIEYYRYVDNENDLTIQVKGDKASIVQEKSFQHPFGTVPALTCSNIQRLGMDGKLSPFDKIKEDLEEYLRDQGVLSIYKYKNIISIPVRPGIICNECRGTGKIDHQECRTCNGTGEIMRKDVTDEIIIPIDITADNVNFPQNIGYYLQPDLDTAKYYEENLEKKAMSQYDTLWGITIERETQQTATEVMINAQPKIHKLNEWSDVAQYMEYEFTEMIANWMFPNKNKSANVSTIYYGRVYLIRTTEQIMEELTKAIKDGLPDSIKHKIYVEYITTKFKNDPEVLMDELKKSHLEYWPFYNVKEVSDYLGMDAARKKMLFTDWWETLNDEEKIKSEEELEKLRDQWMNDKLKEINDSNMSKLNNTQNMFNQNNYQNE